MRTPREILLARHSGATGEIDAIRERVVANIGNGEEADPRSPNTFVAFLISLRWHAAAMSVVWVLAPVLGSEKTEPAHAGIATGEATPSPVAYMVALREYEREFDESDKSATAPPPIPHACIRPRGSADCSDIA